MRLLEAIAVVARFTDRTTHRKALKRHADLIDRASQQANFDELDHKDIQERYLAALKAIKQE